MNLSSAGANVPENVTIPTGKKPIQFEVIGRYSSTDWGYDVALKARDKGQFYQRSTSNIAGKDGRVAV